MKFTPKIPPRRFQVGQEGKITMEDVGRLELAPNELVTVVTEDGSEFDIARKEWGFYGTPSLNTRLPAKGLRPCLTRGPDWKYYILLVEKGREDAFFEYVRTDQHTFLTWLDNEQALTELTHGLPGQAGR